MKAIHLVEVFKQIFLWRWESLIQIPLHLSRDFPLVKNVLLMHAAFDLMHLQKELHVHWKSHSEL